MVLAKNVTYTTDMVFTCQWARKIDRVDAEYQSIEWTMTSAHAVHSAMLRECGKLEKQIWNTYLRAQAHETEYGRTCAEIGIETLDKDMEQAKLRKKVERWVSHPLFRRLCYLIRSKAMAKLCVAKLSRDHDLKCLEISEQCKHIMEMYNRQKELCREYSKLYQGIDVPAKLHGKNFYGHVGLGRPTMDEKVKRAAHRYEHYTSRHVEKEIADCLLILHEHAFRAHLAPGWYKDY